VSDPDQLALLVKSTDEWNKYVDGASPEFQPDLIGANLTNPDSSRRDLGAVVSAIWGCGGSACRLFGVPVGG
jgi:hypothetical protein